MKSPNYAKSEGITIAKVFKDKVSGSRVIAQRKESRELIEYLISNRIKLILVSEISRLGRSAIDVQRTIDTLVSRKINIYSHQHKMYLLDETGNYSAMSKLIIDTYANIAQMELETLTARIKSGLREAKRKGVVLGRPVGSIMDKKAILSKYPKVVKELKEGMSLRVTAKKCECSINTVRKVKTAIPS